MLTPRQLAPTVGPAHDGVVFLEGALPGIEKLAIGRMTKSRRGKLYIDDAGWGPETDSIESGFRVPFGKIHVFIGFIGESVQEPETAAVPVESGIRVSHGKVSAFVGFIGGTVQEPETAADSVSGGATLVYSDGESSVGENDRDETESILPLFDEKLGGCSDGEEYPASYGPPRHAAVYMAGNQNQSQPRYDGQGNLITAPPNPSSSQNQVTNAGEGATAAAGGAGSEIPGSQALAATAAALAALLADPVTPENADARKAEIEKCREQLAQVRQNIEAENARLATAQKNVLQEAQRLENEGVHLEFRQGELSTVQQRRYQSRLPARIEPRMLFQTPQDPIAPGAGTRAPGAGTAMPQSAQGVVPPNLTQQSPAHQQPPALQQYQLQQPAQQQQQPARFHTPAGHFSNPVDNVWAATHNLSLIPINGNNPFEVEARKAIEMLKTAVTQQANYSHSPNRLHSTPYNSRSRSRHGESPAVSSSAWRQREHQNQQPALPQPIQQPRPAVSDAQAIVDSARAARAANAGNTVIDHVQPAARNMTSPPATTQPAPSGTGFVGRTIGTQCLGPALRNERLPQDFKGPRKVPNYTADMEPAAWIESYELAMDMLEASDGVCARYLTMMLEGPARTWLKNLPPNSIHTWQELKDRFIKNFQGTCKRPTTIIDLEHCVQKEGESAHHWARRVAEIIHSSESITAQTAVLVLEKNCRFDPLIHKLGRIKRTVKDMSELMDAMTKYAESDKTKDPDSDEEKSGKTKKNGGKGHQNNNNGNGNNKRKNSEGSSDLVANTNAGYKNQRQNGNFKRQSQGFRPSNYQEALKAPCPRHSRPNRPASHSWEDCYIMQEFKNGGSGGNNNNGGNNGGQPGNPGAGNPGASNSGAGRQGAGQGNQQQGGMSGFQSNPKQLNSGQYHVFTTNTCKRDQKLRKRAVNTVAPAAPQWLNWSEQPITWSRADHPPRVDNPGSLALVVAPQVGGYKLTKVLMDGGSSINILYYDTFKRMNLSEKQLQPSSTIFHGIVPGKSAHPVGKIYLEVAFGTEDNFRSEILPFEVVKFKSPYHALFGRPAYARFMARPCYVYLKMKMPSPRRPPCHLLPS